MIRNSSFHWEECSRNSYFLCDTSDLFFQIYQPSDIFSSSECSFLAVNAKFVLRITEQDTEIPKKDFCLEWCVLICLFVCLFLPVQNAQIIMFYLEFLWFAFFSM